MAVRHMLLGLLLLAPGPALADSAFPVTPNAEAEPGSNRLNIEPGAERPVVSTVPSPTSPVPPQLADMQEIDEGIDPIKGDNGVGLEIRNDAIREAALSYGARGGLAYRTFEIQRRLAEQENALGRIYDFKRLLINAQSGLLLEAPIVSEAEKAVIVAGGGQTAAVADRVYRINQGAQIVTAARDWRLYMERDWGMVEPPPKVLLPRNAYERNQWRLWVKEGWEAGVEQANDIFQADLDRMNHDFVGMVRYRELLAQGMISPPFALAEDRGITGGGAEMRIGDRGLTITGQPELIAKGNQWQGRSR